MRPNIVLLALLLVFTLSCSTSPTNQAITVTPSPGSPTIAGASTDSEDADETSSVVFTVPVGPSGITYANTDTDESEPWGPSALRIAPDGSFLIVNTVDNSILRYGAEGNALAAIKIDDAVGITDVAVDEKNIFVLDEAAPAPALIRLNTEGQMLEKRLLSPQLLRQGLSGVTLSDKGAVLLEFDGGVAARGMDGSVALDRSLRGQPYAVHLPSLRDQVVGGKRPFLSKGEQRLEIKTDNPVSGLKVLSVNDEGHLFVVVDEIAATPQVAMDQTIRRYDANGNLTGIARVPIRKRFTHVEHAIAVNRHGQPFALVTYREVGQVRRFNFVNQLKPILPKSTYTADSSGLLTNCSQTRAQITARANKFIANKVLLNVTNLDGACSGRTKPRYLKSNPSQYESVAYDWGGWDTVEDYNQRMGQNEIAGDIHTAGVEECSRGVDCSGFVTRCWGITSQKYGTATLPDISTEINVVDLQPGDILNYVKRHVILFDKFAREEDGGDGVMAWESTTTNKGDRVMHRRSSWRRLLGYVARRYKQVC